MLIVPGLDPIALRPGVTTIGRSEESDIIIEDHQVSRHHAQIECVEGICRIEDLQSSNGCFVNGERVERVVLRSGDRLRIGDAQMTYRAPEQREGPVGGPAAMEGAWLEVDGERYTVPASGLIIGRSAENEVRLVDRLASRKHARVELRQGTHVLVDLDSANGTFVNGQRVRQHVLRDGDEIRIGSSRITFHSQTGR
jgi:pSer/pThr/pTyr-binding forkhead associated (FHA) protein